MRVKLSETEECTEDQNEEESVTVVVKFMEKVDSCLLADPFVVSWQVKKELGHVESVRVTRSGLMIIACVSVGQRKNALEVKRMGARKVNCFVLKKRATIKGVITGVAVNIKVDQLRGKIPGVCDAHRLM